MDISRPKSHAWSGVAVAKGVNVIISVSETRIFDIFTQIQLTLTSQFSDA
jgi:hypothetical protein